MKYRYPKIKNCLIFQRTGQDTVEITDSFTEKKWTLNLEAAKYVRKLDGKTNPHRIPTAFTRKQVDALIQALDKRGMLQKSRLRRMPYGTFFLSLWEPKRSPSFRMASAVWNFLLLILCLPVFLAGFLTFLLHFWRFEFVAAGWGLPIGLIVGMALHELSHVFAAGAYDASVQDVGITLQYIFLPGMYSVIDTRKVQNRLHRIQILGAGFEMNTLLTGLFLIFGALIPKLGGMFLLAAGINAFFVLTNLILLKNSDGSAILAETLGVEQLAEKAESVVRSKDKKIALAQNGIVGIANIGICYLLFALQLVLPILLILNILEVIIWLI